VGGGRHMNLYCTGNGSPTVVLMADGDDPTLAWRYVQPAVAKKTRVCSYDSEGIGFSDPAALPLDANAQVRDVHALLIRGGIAGPLVLVGYSESGLVARLYADRYLRAVAGMVLVGPNLPNEHARMVVAAPALAPMLAQLTSFDTICYTAVANGTMRPGTKVYGECMYTPPGPALPKALADLNVRQWERPSTWLDFRSADEAFDTTSSAAVRREQRSYGAMPLIVLSEDSEILQLPIPAAQRTALARAWISWNDQVAALSARGANFAIDGTSQAIPIDRPSVVVGAVDEVIDQARAL